MLNNWDDDEDSLLTTEGIKKLKEKIKKKEEEIREYDFHFQAHSVLDDNDDD